jgi:hypothetical protein
VIHGASKRQKESPHLQIMPERSFPLELVQNSRVFTPSLWPIEAYCGVCRTAISADENKDRGPLEQISLPHHPKL